MRRIGLVGLMQIDFPGRTVRLCDGGFVKWGDDIFASADAVFGTIANLEPMGEGVGAQVPALALTLLPPGSTTPAQMVQPGFQTARARLWMAEFNPATDALTGTPDLLFDGQVDRVALSVGRDRRELAITIVSLAERLFEGRIGNSLSPSWHQTIWPGERGHDNATGLGQPIAWGTEKPPSFTGAPVVTSGLRLLDR